MAVRELAASGASRPEIARGLARADPEAYLADVIDRMAKGTPSIELFIYCLWNYQRSRVKLAA